MKRLTGLVFLLLLCGGPAALAQIAGGNVYGTVADASGARLPGATVTLGGPFTQTTTTGENGQFRFLNVPADTYTLTISMTGFTTVKRDVIVTTNQSIELGFSLSLAAVQESVTVTAETPVVDTKKFGTATTLSKAELTEIPNSRDPWAVLRTVPGVVLDRVNIAGNESGQQSNFAGKGAAPEDITWNLDGVQIDDMAAAGATPTYFDYDAFEEFAVTTGGNDVAVQTGAIGLNFVTKRGTNQWRGSARGYLTHDDLQWSNIKGTELDGDPRLGGSDKADHIQQINDYGADLGGPILKDKLWVYGSYGKQDIRLKRTNQTDDKTILTTWSAKLNWQVTSNTQFSYLFFNGKKEKFGRDIGLGVELDPGTLWNQGNAYADSTPLGLHGMHKLELNQIFNPNFYMNVKYTNYDTGFSAAPAGGLGGGAAVVDFDASKGYGPYEDYYTTRPLKHVTDVTGRYFADGLGGSHELKFGFGYKKVEVSTSDIYGGDSGLLGYFYEPGLGGAYALVWRNVLIDYGGDFWYGYLSDTYTRDRFTLSAGLRWDSQESVNLPGKVPANQTFPDVMPGLDYQGGGAGIKWNTVSPRVGMSYALDESRRTVLRGNFAIYKGKLDAGATTIDNPVGYSYMAYLWDDVNDDRRLTPDEVRLDLGVQYYNAIDPANPSALVSPNTIDPDYKAPTDYEVIVGIDREVFPDFAVGASYTWRRANDLRGYNQRLGLTAADYTANPPETANGYTAQTWSPDPDKVAATGGGIMLMNRPDYHQGYNGVEFTAFKRLSHKWMARVAFAWMDWKEYYDGPNAYQNPTRTDTSSCNGCPSSAGPLVDGGQYIERSGGSGKGDSFYNAKWQLSASALYQLPAGFEVAAALFGRQGFARPIVLRLGAGDDGRLRALATSALDSERYPDLWNLDLRLAKDFRIGRANLNIAADFFNVFNSNTVLNRIRQANSSTFNRLDEILSPRVLRLGARFTF